MPVKDYNKKLNADKAQRIRDAVAAGQDIRVVAIRYGITQGYVMEIVQGKRWKPTNGSDHTPWELR